MGTWGTGPFDSDMAADFVDGLAGMSTEQVGEATTRAFQRVVDSGSRVDGGDGAEAIAAAALLACQIPGSHVVIDPDDGPAEPLPVLPISLRPEAGRALRRVLEDGSEMAEAGSRPLVRRHGERCSRRSLAPWESPPDYRRSKGWNAGSFLWG
ncbi:DUF4259 domain-containing protein [Streptomyces sp. NPDC058701]|uniref:DUF4259 domain-containing protein n=1 Tax=Streptomyces sp. NPDC058701 TaxID=3346608 RepID=UPI00366156A3